MQPEHNHHEVGEMNHARETGRLHEVTPLSKYLAMALFVLLPFVGGYVGYAFAPEKVVKMESVKIIEMQSEENKYNTIVDPSIYISFEKNERKGLSSKATLEFIGKDHSVSFDYSTHIEINPSAIDGNLLVALKEKKGDGFLNIQTYSNGLCWYGICTDEIEVDTTKIGSMDWFSYKNFYCYDGICPDTYVYEYRLENQVLYAHSNINLKEVTETKSDFGAEVRTILESIKFESSPE